MTPQTKSKKEAQKKGLFPMPLNKFLSMSGVSSRRKCADVVRQGRVLVNGSPASQPGLRINEGDSVSLDGDTLSIEDTVHVMFNKPVGAVCTAADLHAKTTVFDHICLPGVRLFNVGRLDKDSEGLLILTNDGDYAMRLMHPRHGATKVYLVETQHILTRDDIRAIRLGVESNGDTLRALDVREVANCKYLFEMGEGKKREIRRMVARSMNKVRALKRVAVGKLFLDRRLKPGQWRLMTDDEVEASLQPGFKLEEMARKGVF